LIITLGKRPPALRKKQPSSVLAMTV